MTTQVLILRVFISSPGDVSVERSLVTKIIANIQCDPLYRKFQGVPVEIKPVGWDIPGLAVPLTADSSPQECINAGLPLPGDCDIVIVIFNQRMGTKLDESIFPPRAGRPYESGTEWEFWNAVDNCQKKRWPMVKVFRKQTPAPPKNAPADIRDQWQRLEKFFRTVFDSPTGAIKRSYDLYRDEAKFHELLAEQMRTMIARTLERRTRPQPANTETGLHVGQCSECKTIHQDWDDRRVCGHCANGVIAEPCLNCGTWNGRWNRYCKICQGDFGATYQRVLEFIKPLARQPTEPMIEAASRLLKIQHPRVRNDRPQLAVEIRNAKKILDDRHKRDSIRQATELRQRLLEDLTDHELRREYLRSRTQVQIKQDRAYGEDLEDFWIDRVTLVLTLLVITIPLIPIGVKHVKSLRFVELSESYGPLPLMEYRLSREELDTRYSR